MADVFISYARTERAEAELVKARLEAMGLTVFLDIDGLDGGDVFSEKLDREVKTAGVVLGLWSPVSLTRPWVQTECDIGKRRGVLIPVAVHPFRDMDVPAPFWNIQFIDLTEALHHADDPAWAKLQRSLSRTLARPELAPPRTAPASRSTKQDAPEWMHSRAAVTSRSKAKTTTPLIVGVVVVLLSASAAGLVWLDPLKWRAASAAEDMTALATLPAAANAAPDPAGLGSQEMRDAFYCAALMSMLAQREPGAAPELAALRDSAKARLEARSAELAGKEVVAVSPTELHAAHDKRLSSDMSAGKPRITEADCLVSAGLAATVGGIAAPTPSPLAAPPSQPTVRMVLEQTLTGPTGNVRSADFSRDGTRVLTAALWSQPRLWDATTGRLVATLDITDNGGTSVATAIFSPDGARIAIGDASGRVLIWESQNGKLLTTLSGHSRHIRDIDFSLDGSRVVTTSGDGTARVWNTSSGETLFTLSGHSGGVSHARFSPNGMRVVTGGDDYTARVWDVQTGQNILTLTEPLQGSKFIDAIYAANGTRIITSANDGVARVWDANSGQMLLKLPGGGASGGEWHGFVASPDGNKVAAGYGRRQAKILDATTGKVLATLSGHEDQVLGIDYSLDGSLIVTGSVDDTARLWDAATGRALARIADSGPVFGAAFSPDGAGLVTASGGNNAKIWRIERE